MDSSSPSKKITKEDISNALASLSGMPPKDVDDFLEAFFLIGRAKLLLAKLKSHHQNLTWGTGERCIGTIRKIPRSLKSGAITEDMRIYHPAGKSCPRCGELKNSKKSRRIEKTVARAEWQNAIEAIENHKELCAIDELIHRTINAISEVEENVPVNASATLRVLLQQGQRLSFIEKDGSNFANRKMMAGKKKDGADDSVEESLMLSNGNGVLATNGLSTNGNGSNMKSHGDGEFIRVKTGAV